MLHLSASETGAMAAHALPESAIAASMAFYDKDLIPGFRGDLLLPSKDAMQILRVQFDPARRATVTFHASAFPDVGAARVVAVSPTGEVYFCTADALVRVSPRR